MAGLQRSTRLAGTPQHRMSDHDAERRRKKLALGTVQFGKAYGVANESGQVAPEVVTAILECARKGGIDTLDTAAAYGNSEAVLGASGVAGWRIITKLPPLPPDVSDVRGWIAREIKESLDRLRVARLDGLILHRPGDLLGPAGQEYRDALDAAREACFVDAVGVSIYAPAELDALWPVFRPALVQAPLSVLDRRLIHSGWLDRLHAAGVRVHTRSSFLQGLLLMPPEKRPAYFQPWTAMLDEWQAWCREAHCSPLQAALAFCLEQAGVERVVVGVDAVPQLNEILDAAGRPVAKPPVSLASDDVALIEPSRWTLE